MLWGSEESSDGNFWKLHLGAEKTKLVIRSHQFPVTRGESQHLCPLHGGLRVAKENAMQSGTRWNNALASAPGFGPPWNVEPPGGRWMASGLHTPFL